MPEKDELDRLVDSALATYADPGPDSGLERRVLSALAGERGLGNERSGWALRLPWMIAIPLAASLLLWVAISRVVHSPVTQSDGAQGEQANHAPRTQTPRGDMASSEQKLVQQHRSSAKASAQSRTLAARVKSCPVAAPEPGSEGTGRSSNTCAGKEQDFSSGSQNAQATGLPKLDVFPTPRPLSPEERALVVSVQAPEPPRSALVKGREQDDDSVHIAAIHIPPIEPPSQTQP